MTSLSLLSRAFPTHKHTHTHTDVFFLNRFFFPFVHMKVSSKILSPSLHCDVPKETPGGDTEVQGPPKETNYEHAQSVHLSCDRAAAVSWQQKQKPENRREDVKGILKRGEKSRLISDWAQRSVGRKWMHEWGGGKNADPFTVFWVTLSCSGCHCGITSKKVAGLIPGGSFSGVCMFCGSRSTVGVSVSGCLTDEQRTYPGWNFQLAHPQHSWTGGVTTHDRRCRTTADRTCTQDCFCLFLSHLKRRAGLIFLRHWNTVLIADG